MDSPHDPEKTNIDNLLYTSVPSYTTSDHVCLDILFISPYINLLHHQKPIVALLQLPPCPAEDPPSTPLLTLPATYRPMPDRYANLKRYVGRVFDRIIGIIWSLLTLFGAGSVIAGVFNFLVGVGAWTWWKSRPSALEESE